MDFLHRTIVEFLRRDKIWIQSIAMTNGAKFNVNKVLLSSLLAEMKAKPPTPAYSDYMPPAYYNMLLILSYEHKMNDMREIFLKAYLPEVMSLYWHEPSLLSSPEIETQAMIEATIRGCNRLELSYPASFIRFTASHCPKTHLHSLFEWHLPFYQRGKEVTQKLLPECSNLELGSTPPDSNNNNITVPNFFPSSPPPPPLSSGNYPIKDLTGASPNPTTPRLLQHLRNRTPRTETGASSSFHHLFAVCAPVISTLRNLAAIY